MTEQNAEDDFEGPTPVEEEGFEHAMAWHGDAEKVAKEWAEKAKADGDIVGFEWWLQIAAFSADFWALNKEKIERMTFRPDENVNV